MYFQIRVCTDGEQQFGKLAKNMHAHVTLAKNKDDSIVFNYQITKPRVTFEY